MKKKNLALIIVLAIMGLALILSVVFISGMNMNTRIIRHSTEHAVYYCKKSGVALSRAISDAVENACFTAQESLKLTTSAKIKLVICQSREEYTAARDNANAGSSEYAFLLQKTVYISPDALSEEGQRSVAYQAVRSMMRSFTSREEPGFLCDALAALCSDQDHFSTLKGAAAQGESFSAGALSQRSGVAQYEAFKALSDADGAKLYVVFLSEEGLKSTASGSLWRVIRARQPIDYKRATGYDEGVWDAAWKAWLSDFKPYDLGAYVKNDEG